MSRANPLKEDLELRQLRLADQQLLLRQKECAEIPRKLEMELKERESTLPPHPEIEERRLRRQHEDIVSRGQIQNILRTQGRSLALLLLLLTATSSLIWWGVKLMQG